MSVKPISPNDVTDLKKNLFPDEVIRCWNEAIASAYNNGNARVEQNNIVRVLMLAFNTDRDQVFSHGWLDVEDIYRSKGWKVVYFKPHYTESWEPYFIFQK